MSAIQRHGRWSGEVSPGRIRTTRSRSKRKLDDMVRKALEKYPPKAKSPNRETSLRTRVSYDQTLCFCWLLCLRWRLPRRPRPPRRRVPRTADGHPDLQGVWTNATLTPMERPASFAGKLNLTDDEAAKFEKAPQEEVAAGDGKSDSDFHRRAGSGETGGYNALFIDRGSELARVDGVKRTSLVIDPPDGKVPAIDAGSAAAHADDAARNVSLRRQGPAAVGALPDELRIQFRAAHAAGAVQQQLSDRPDAGYGHDSGGDGPRRRASSA